MTKPFALALLATLALSGCGTSGPPEPTAAEFTMTVSPVPLIVRWACPQHAPGDPPPTQCFLSMDPVISIKESAGVGGNIIRLHVAMSDSVTNQSLVGVTLDRDWVVANAGTDRIDENTTLAFRAVINNYPLRFSERPNLNLAIGARLVDDKGNELTPGFRAEIR
jgi:hypothetical protein